MHPILVSGRRLLGYLLAWLLLLAFMAYVAFAAAGMLWRDAATVLAPACLIYAFDCLSPWYICRVRPLTAGTAPSLAVTWLAAAAGGGLTLAGCAWLAGWLLNKPVGNRFALFFAMGVLLYLLSAGLHYAALAVESSREAERRAAEARTLAREAQLQSLKFQLNPHFLFNSLNSIAALATLDGARAREMCVRLADFLRSSLGLENRERIPLDEELSLARSYLEVERVRFGDRLRIVEEIEPGCRQCAVPALLLQPLVENAVKHGIAGLVEGGWIRIAARWRSQTLIITVENSFDPEGAGNSSGPGRMGLGLAHVKRRLAMRYGDQAEMEAHPAEGVYQVVLRLPCEG
jgi:two-component system, LytTR family, sensor histidine kinase AlgZ